METKAGMKRKKLWRGQSIIVQVGVVLGIIIVLVNAYLLYSISRYFYQEFVASIGQIMAPKIDKMNGRLEEMDRVGLHYMADYWRNHAEEMKDFLKVDENFTMLYQKYPENNPELMADDKYLLALHFLTEEEFRELSPEMQQKVAEFAQMSLLTFGIETIDLLHVKDSYLYDKESGLVFFYLNDEIDIYELKAKDIPALYNEKDGELGINLKKELEDDIWLCVNGNGEKRYLYNYEVHLKTDKYPELIFGIDQDVTELAALTLERFWTVTIFLSFVIVIELILVLGMVYFSACVPVRKIRKGMQIFEEERDPDKTGAYLSQIQVNAEMNEAAKLLSELVSTVVQYSREYIANTAAQEKIAMELSLATSIQQDALPKDFPDRKEFSLYARMTPAREVAGDFYDFFFIDDDHLGLVIADVCGKGVAAALFMMMSKIHIKDSCNFGISPGEAIGRANNAIHRDNPNMMFVTVWYGCLEISTGHVVAVNAGHTDPIVRRGDGLFAYQEEKHDRFLGFLPNLSFHEYDFYLEKGGVLFLYSDGLTEAQNVSKELYGGERLLASLNKVPDGSPRALVDMASEDIQAFAGRAPQFDDQTILCIKYHGAATGEA